MEYIEYDIKHLIYEKFNNKIVPYSVELNCEMPGAALNNMYDSCVYYTDEVDGTIEVFADFNCLVEESGNEIQARGSFKGRFYLEQKHFLEDTCEVSI